MPNFYFREISKKSPFKRQTLSDRNKTLESYDLIQEKITASLNRANMLDPDGNLDTVAIAAASPERLVAVNEEIVKGLYSRDLREEIGVLIKERLEGVPTLGSKLGKKDYQWDLDRFVDRLAQQAANRVVLNSNTFSDPNASLEEISSRSQQALITYFRSAEGVKFTKELLEDSLNIDEKTASVVLGLDPKSLAPNERSTYNLIREGIETARVDYDYKADFSVKNGDPLDLYGDDAGKRFAGIELAKPQITSTHNGPNGGQIIYGTDYTGTEFIAHLDQNGHAYELNLKDSATAQLSITRTVAKEASRTTNYEVIPTIDAVANNFLDRTYLQIQADIARAQQIGGSAKSAVQSPEYVQDRIKQIVMDPYKGIKGTVYTGIAKTLFPELRQKWKYYKAPKSFKGVVLTDFRSLVNPYYLMRVEDLALWKAIHEVGVHTGIYAKTVKFYPNGSKKDIYVFKPLAFALNVPSKIYRGGLGRLENAALNKGWKNLAGVFRRRREDDETNVVAFLLKWAIDLGIRVGARAIVRKLGLDAVWERASARFYDRFLSGGRLEGFSQTFKVGWSGVRSVFSLNTLSGGYLGFLVGGPTGGIVGATGGWLYQWALDLAKGRSITGDAALNAFRHKFLGKDIPGAKYFYDAKGRLIKVEFNRFINWALGPHANFFTKLIGRVFGRPVNFLFRRSLARLPIKGFALGELLFGNIWGGLLFSVIQMLWSARNLISRLTGLAGSGLAKWLKGKLGTLADKLGLAAKLNSPIFKAVSKLFSLLSLSRILSVTWLLDVFLRVLGGESLIYQFNPFTDGLISLHFLETLASWSSVWTLGGGRLLTAGFRLFASRLWPVITRGFLSLFRIVLPRVISSIIPAITSLVSGLAAALAGALTIGLVVTVVSVVILVVGAYLLLSSAIRDDYLSNQSLVAGYVSISKSSDKIQVLPGGSIKYTVNYNVQKTAKSVQISDHFVVKEFPSVVLDCGRGRGTGSTADISIEDITGGATYDAVIDTLSLNIGDTVPLTGSITYTVKVKDTAQKGKTICNEAQISGQFPEDTVQPLHLNRAVNTVLVGDQVITNTFLSGWPTDHGWIDQGPYGTVSHQNSVAIDIHCGAPGAYGSCESDINVHVTHDGIVEIVANGCANGCGKYVQVSSLDGSFRTYYGHLKAQTVEAGQKVRKGQVIGKMDCTGECNAPHVHYDFLHSLPMRPPYIPVTVPQGCVGFENCGSVSW